MNIFIASLPFQLEEVDIKETFEDYGEVTSVRLITDRETGRKKGFGFVQMPNDEEALKAIQELNGTEIFQRKISVSKAEERGDRSGGGGGGYSANKRPGGYSNNQGGGGGGYNRDGGSRDGGSRDGGGYKGRNRNEGKSEY